MNMPARVRKFALAVHLAASIGWIGAVLMYLALGVAAATGGDPLTVRGAWMAMELTGWYVIVPLAVGSLLTGVVMGVGTRWGLLRYYWVVFALGLTTFATVVLILHMPSVSASAEVSRQARGERLYGLGGDLFHPAVGLVLLLAVLVLNVYKPPGMTLYGWRRRMGAADLRTTPAGPAAKSR